MQQLPLFGLIYALPCHDGLPYKRYMKLGSIQPQHSLYEIAVAAVCMKLPSVGIFRALTCVLDFCAQRFKS